MKGRKSEVRKLTGEYRMANEKNRRGETDEENNEKLQVKWEEWGGRVIIRERGRIETDSVPAWNYNRQKLAGRLIQTYYHTEPCCYGNHYG